MSSSLLDRLGSAVRHIDPFIWLVIAFSLFAVLPLTGPDYFFDAHDAPHTVFFLTEFDAALRDGVWYPGWATDQALGYGYPTFVFYPPLAYYVAELFHLAGAGKVTAVKWVWALATIGAGLAMYAYGRRTLGRQRGLLAAVVYVYVPYHLADIYVRADLAEYSVFAWLPLALLAFHRLVEQPTARRLALAGLTFGGLWLTHNVTGLVFTPLLAAYVLFRLFAESATWRDGLWRAGASLGGALLGLGIAAALILPNVFERAYIVQEQWVRAGYDYTLHFLRPADLLSGTWGYAPGVPGTEAGMSFQLGVVPIILSAVAVVRALVQPIRSRAKINPGDRGLIIFFAGATLLLLFLMLPLSAPLWELLPLVALVQFPWRLLALTTVSLAILSGLSISTHHRPVSKAQDSAPDNEYPALQQHLGPRRHLSGQLRLVGLTTSLCLVAVLASYPYTVPQYTPIPESAESPLLSIEFELKYEDMRGMTAWTEEMPPDSPLVAQYLAGEPLVTATALAPDASVAMIRAGGASDELWVRSPEGTALRFYTYYFPGWQVYIDGEQLPDSALRPETRYGLITVDIPPGEHHVLLRWGDTPLRRVGKALTLASLVLAVALLVPWRRRRNS